MDVSGRAEEIKMNVFKDRAFAVLLGSGLIAAALVTGAAISGDGDPGPAREIQPAQGIGLSTKSLGGAFALTEVSGLGGIEPITNCRIRSGGAIEITDAEECAVFRVVPEQGATVSVKRAGGVALRSGDAVTIQPGWKTGIYEIEFRENRKCGDEAWKGIDQGAPGGGRARGSETMEIQLTEATGPSTSEAPGVLFDWYAPEENEPSPDGIVDYGGQGWYCAHSNTVFGEAIAALQPGDRVSVNGRVVTIEGRARNRIGTYIDPLWDEIGREKVLFSTCIEDGSDDVWVVYGE